MHSLLLIEDNVEISNVIQLILEAEGFPVTVVETAQEAFLRIRSGQFSAILMDYYIDGFDCEKFVRYAESVKTTVILMTCATDIEEKKRNLRVQYAIKKPFDESELIATVKQACKSQSSSRMVSSVA